MIMQTKNDIKNQVQSVPVVLRVENSNQPTATTQSLPAAPLPTVVINQLEVTYA